MGDLKFIDTNGDGVITDADKVLTGCYTPKQTFSFGASLDWKGFDFSFMFQGVAGNYIYNGTKQMGMNGHGGDFGNLIEDVFDTWDFNPSGSKYPRLGLAEDNNGNYTKFSDAFLEKGDYLRLKNITLGYTLPKHIARHIGLTNGSLRVYVSIDNVATITGYSGIDPEVGQLRSRCRHLSVVAFLQLRCKPQLLNFKDHEKNHIQHLPGRRRSRHVGVCRFPRAGILR